MTPSPPHLRPRIPPPAHLSCFSVHAAPRQRHSPPSPLSVFTAPRLSVCTAALRPRHSPFSSLSVLAALRPPLSVLVALRPRRAPPASPSGPRSAHRSPSSPLCVLAALRPSLSTLAAPAMSTLPPLAPAALLTPVPPPQVQIMRCSNHITGISAANVRKVSNVTRGTLKLTLEIRLRLHSLSFSQVTDSIMNSCTYSGPYSDNFHREGTLHTSMTRNPTRTPTRGLHFARHGTVTSRLSNRRLRGSLRTNDVNDIHTPGRTASSATQGARVV